MVPLGIWLEREGKTVRELAEALGGGVSPQSVSGWARGEVTPSLDAALKLSAVTGLDLVDFLKPSAREELEAWEGAQGAGLSGVLPVLEGLRGALLSDLERPTAARALELAWASALLAVVDKARATRWRRGAEAWLEESGLRRAEEGGENE